jgi:hypothetical protein
LCFLQHSYLFEERQENHPTLAKFGTENLHTLRLVTVRNGDDFLPLVASMRFGTAGSLVDSFSQGGVCSAVDLKTGILSKGVKEEGASLPRSIEHIGPHQQKLAGTLLPFHDDVIALGISVHKSLPKIFSLGHDTAITIKGPLIIETNHLWSSTFIQKPQDKGFGAMPLFVESVMTANDRLSRKSLL